MRRSWPAWLITLVALVGLTIAAPLGASAGSSVENEVLDRALQIELGQVTPNKYEMRVSSGPVYALLQYSGELDRRLQAAVKNEFGGNASGTAGCTNTYAGGGRGGLNTRVNQDCSLRRQAEEVVAVNPTNPNNLIAGQNDSRLGYNHCGYDWSFDGGKTWGDLVPPFWQYVLPDGHTADACSDPTVAFDADGNAYVAGILFDVASVANAVVVAKSNAPIGGAFYHTPVPGPFQEYTAAPLGIVTADNDPAVFNDKELIAADASASSPKKNNVYATWTRFAATGAGVGVDSPIYFSQSTDGGATWSPGIAISGSNAAVCAIFSGSPDPNACDQDQGSHPVVGADGTVYVAFGNGNTPNLGYNQVLFVSCPGTADCTDPTNWSAPVKVGDLVGIQPVGPDGNTGCPGGRGCLPPNGYRVPESTSISAAVDDASRVYVTWADARNLVGSSCDWAGGASGSAQTATPPCDNDVFYASSTDGGATWSATHTISPAGSAQWQPWSAVSPGGDSLWVGYYDRSYGDCEVTGCNDITLAQVRNPAGADSTVAYTRMTTDSMPNLVPANNPLQAGFLGDYMWVAVDGKGKPILVWADTRGRSGTVEEDIYFARKP